MAIIRELEARLTLNSSAFHKGLKQSLDGIHTWANHYKYEIAIVTAAIATIGAAFYSLSKIVSESTEKVSKLHDEAEKLGVGAEGLQRLQYAAGQAGASSEELSKALFKLQVNIGKAVHGGDDATKVFKNLGLSANDLAKLPVDQQFLAVADAIKKIPNASEQAASKLALMGKGAQSVAALMTEDIRGLLEEFDKLGILLSQDQVNAIESYGDSARKVGLIWEGFKNQLTAALAGPLKQFVEYIVATTQQYGGLGQVAINVADSMISSVNTLIGFFEMLQNNINGTKRGMLEEVQLLLARQSILEQSRLAHTTDAKQRIASSNLIIELGQKLIKVEKQLQSYEGDNNRNRYNQSMRDQLTSTSKISSLLTEQNNSRLSAVALEQQKTAEMEKQVKAATAATDAQRKQNSLLIDMASMTSNLVGNKGTDVEKYMNNNQQARAIESQLSKLGDVGLLKGLEQQVGSLKEGLKSFWDRQDKTTYGDLTQSRLGDLSKAVSNLNDPRNAFGAGNTPNEQKVKLDVLIQLEEGLKAQIVNSKENADVVTGIVDSRMAQAASAGARR